VPRQFAADNLAVVFVVFDNKDMDGLRFSLLAGNSNGEGPMTIVVEWLRIVQEREGTHDPE
jgi:hypothetical protein